MSIQSIKKQLQQLKRQIVILSFGVVCCLTSLVVSTVYPGLLIAFLCILGGALAIAGGIGVYRAPVRRLRYEEQDPETQDDLSIHQQNDQRRLTISAIVWVVVTIILGWSWLLLNRYAPEMSKLDSMAYSGMWISALVLFPVLKDFLYIYFTRRLIGFVRVRRRKRMVLEFLAFTAVYWLVTYGVYRMTALWPVKSNIYAVALLIYVALFVIFGLLNNEFWTLLPYISMLSSVPHEPTQIDYDEESGVYTVQMNQNRDFKILQLTDIHLGGSFLSFLKDQKAIEMAYELIRQTRPDFIVVTGDLVFPLGVQSFSINNYAPMVQFASFMRNVGIPWAFCYGNHDTEFLASHSLDELDRLFDKFSYKNTFSLLYSSKHPAISGRANQMIRLLNADGTVNQLLFLLDSHSYIGKSWSNYDYIHDDQVAWYEKMLEQEAGQAGKMPSSLLFFHIPLPEFREAYRLYKQEDARVKYYYGEVGEKKELISCSNHPSKLFSSAVRLGSTKGMFVGHDHYNNISLRYKGIRLTYGLSIDYLAMPGIAKRHKQRGGTLITLHPDSSFEVKPIRAKSLN